MTLLGGKPVEAKRVAVLTRNQRFRALLHSILTEWKFLCADSAAAASVLLVERGLEVPAHGGDVVWLTPMPLAQERFLLTPISLTELYHLLEVRFFPTPRRHIRLAVDIPVDLKVDDRWHEGRLISLSDRGGRVVCAEEVPRGKVVEVEVRLAGRVRRLEAEAIYSIPAGDCPERAQSQLGVLFKLAGELEFRRIRQYIEKVCIERACAREGIPLSDPCLSWLDVPADPFAGQG